MVEWIDLHDIPEAIDQFEEFLSNEFSHEEAFEATLYLIGELNGGPRSS